MVRPTRGTTALYDIAVIGGGTAGLRLSFALARSGKKILLVEPKKPGGTCLHNGCIPSKAMLHASGRFSQIQSLKALGISTGKPTIDFSKLMRRVKGFVKEGQDHINGSLAKSRVTLLKGRARFVSSDEIRIGRKTFKSKLFVVCTGSSNIIPPIKGLDAIQYMTNENMLALKKLPKSLAIIGGGYISMELATFFSELGSKVTILEELPQVLAKLDGDIRKVLISSMEEKGVSFMTDAKVTNVGKQGRRIKVIYRKKGKPRATTLLTDQLLVAAGRKPNIDPLDLSMAGIKTDKDGGIIVDDGLATSNRNIFAMGDVLGKAMFAHAAKRQTRILLDRLTGKKADKMDFSLVPWAVFTHPPIAGVGLSEQDAKRKRLSYSAHKVKFSRTGRASIIDEKIGFIKVITRNDGRILGCTMIGPRADELIHEFVAVMNSKSPDLATIRKTIHIHPTLAEALESLK